MRESYDFTNASRNPYAKRLKQQITIRIDRDTLGYFKALANETGTPYQTLINLYLRECATSGAFCRNSGALMRKSGRENKRTDLSLRYFVGYAVRASVAPHSARIRSLMRRR